MSDLENSEKIVIAIDAMGGDFGPAEIIPALGLVIQGRPDVFFLIFGDEEKIKPHLHKYKSLAGACEIRHTDKMVKNDEKPSNALRNSKDTSMRLAIEAVKNKEAAAIVSAGNTGALMALSKMVLKTSIGVHRPAIASVMPGLAKDSIMLDLGANLIVDSENLVQFAILGSIFARAYNKMEDTKPSVGLLNIGSEDMKGPEHIRGAAEILSRVDFPGEYYGFVEGDDITKGTVDVIVCDGYAGNVALKTAEGVGKYIKHYINDAFTSNPLAMLGGLFAFFSLRKLKRQTDPRLYNGGVFLGLNGICIKSHGGADALSFSHAVIKAVRLARLGYIEHVAQEISHLTSQESFLSSGN
ncbi:MAG: phosphate acyltransferase PlsX [Alphaproteobacteria bacterium]|nr:phosphate acyltransferase PlsX [Alphaproteobacteria bacterium]